MSLTHPTRRQAVAEIFLGAIIWGFGFIAMRWALLGAGPYWINVTRFVVAVAASAPFLFLLPSVRGKISRDQFRLAMGPGLVLGAALLFQLLGLQYTTVTKNSFLTCLYVVLVPFLEWGVGRIRFSWLQLALTVTALVGAALMTGMIGGHVGGWNRGDLLTLVCAFLLTFQIYFIDRAGPKITSDFAFNTYQSIWAIPVNLVGVFWEPIPVFPPPLLALWGILILAIASQLFAFLLQIRSQKLLPSTVVSMLFLLESPFAAGFAWLIYGETLTAGQAWGAALILVASAGTILRHGAKI